MKRGALWGGGAVLLAVVIVAVAYLFPILSVSSIKVNGTVHADVNAIRDESGISEGDNMLRVDTARVASNVSQVPWVDKVTVSRSWPTAVKIDVVENVPVGYVMDGSTPLVVNAEGRVFLQGVQPEGVLEFVDTPSDDTDAIRAGATAVAALPDDVRGQLERIEVPDAESVLLFFSEGRRVFWGTAERAEEKAEATRVVLSQEGSDWNVSNPAMPTVRDYVPPPAP